MTDLPQDNHAPGTPGEHHRRKNAMKQRILRSTALLPALFTVSNGLLGFASIHYTTKGGLGETDASNLVIAAWMLVGAMICDMLDGRLARMTRRTSDFGAQLDSLCDVISFGVAPAIMMQRLVVLTMRGMRDEVAFIPAERIALMIAGAYVACAALRLARFNVENEPDESAHLWFRGMPSPAAAANIIGLVLLVGRALERQWLPDGWIFLIASIVVPLVTLAVAFLMVSRIKYPHLVNQYIRGKKPFSYLVKLVIVVLAVLIEPIVTAAIAAVGYTLLGLTKYVVQRTRRIQA
ncbi:MAG: CDP-diacylglycerol--serine O-phosphatidyltransferase [Planctomycetes bacterium]|jgi:CDP-diacylglycerol--serine O-phosphatidyltransferase|nr:CDP-diacylglycerol--serine O-phosphatidyltransferase [Planctomycetota bacterium]